MWFYLVLMCLAIGLSIPLLVVGFELLIALLRPSLSLNDETDEDIQGCYKILMPAHNEANIIGNTLSALIHQGVAADSIVVVADNCTDSTAEIAGNLGVIVMERFNKQERGKGFALDYGLDFLKENESLDVLIILDADCEMSIKSIIKSVNSVVLNDQPVQMTNLMRVVRHTSLSQRVAGFAWLVKNKIRPIAVNKLGFPVTLTGTGMAFPWHVISDINIAHGNIVEDMQLGIDCTLKGYPPVFCEQAIVFSDFPEQADAEKTQRTRWEHGHILTIVQQLPILCQQAILRRDWHLFALALDIGVPPLALLVMLCLLGLLICGVLGYLSANYVAFFVLLASFLFFAITFLATWWQVGRDYLTVKELCNIPVYIFSKLSIYTAFLFNRQTDWVRTDRK